MAFYSRGRRPLAEEEKSTDAAKARTRAMELLAGQELSSGQLYERLNRRYTQQTSAAVVAEMVQREYINDARYAETRAHALLAAKKSRRAAAQNLRQKGLAAGEIQQALDENKPVVALESTILSHGMPYPENLDFAHRVEEVVFANRIIRPAYKYLGVRQKYKPIEER